LQEVNLQNENAWADLGNTDAVDDGEADEAEPGMDNDNLWDEFKSREQEEEQRVKNLTSHPFHTLKHFPSRCPAL
jgi:hypothetical protein